MQMVGAVNAFSALLAERAGFRAIYLSGAGVANASFGLPDLGMTNLNDVCEDTRRIAGATNLPLMVDADTGWGNAFNIARAIRDLGRAGAAGCLVDLRGEALGRCHGRQRSSRPSLCRRFFVRYGNGAGSRRGDARRFGAGRCPQQPHAEHDALRGGERPEDHGRVLGKEK